jgi:glycerate kinase
VTGRALRVLIAPDSFKGSLTSVEVAAALGEGWLLARPDDSVTFAPLADGGEGTLEALAAAGGWTWQRAAAHGPDMARLRARWLRSGDGVQAAVELAEASGLSRIAPADREPLAATTFGTGEVLRAAIEAGARRITLGIGGSATTDGGAGILQALGARLLEIDGLPLMDGAAPVLLADVERIDLRSVEPRLAEVDLRIACDVSNPLLGPSGAAAVYGPQKGADPERVAVLEGILAGWADRLGDATGTDERETPGAGAAGGTGFALLSLRGRFGSVRLVPGVEVLMEAADLDGKLGAADLVVTGEGRIDSQTAFGKTALGVARRARVAGVPCVAVGGGVEPEGIVALAEVGATTFAVWEAPVAVEVAMAAGAEPLVRCGERLARRAGEGGIVTP